jgi:uncharacterized protein (DUF779 family)
VTATPAALTALARLREQRGPVVLYQTSGCCGGSSPICFVRGDLLIGDGDLLLGRVGDCPVYIDDRLYEIWKHTQLIIDVAAGAPEAFSLPAGEQKQGSWGHERHRDQAVDGTWLRPETRELLSREEHLDRSGPPSRQEAEQEPTAAQGRNKDPIAAPDVMSPFIHEGPVSATQSRDTRYACRASRRPGPPG